ncbi:MAG TPA: phospholipid carrier-dependent glycosyltransferase [Chthoniobacterales bacterium]|nr:phospholipid carrier-dependent glycosyltransferase [Chthoniobacterales bacterium]
MSSAETKLQELVHSVEQGRLASVIRILLACAAAVGLALAYLLIQFRGLSTQSGMDQAQIAREIARWNGFSTKMIRPYAAQQLQDHTGRIPAANFPDSFHAPLNPLANSLVMRLLPGELTKTMSTSQHIFAGDRLIAGLSIFFFLAAVALNFFLVLQLFDSRIAWLTTVLVLIADQFWQFSLSGLPQMLLLFLFTCACAILTNAMRARREGRGTLLWLSLLGIVLGLMALTHPLTLWITAAIAVICGIYMRGMMPRFLVPLGICLTMFSVWIVRDLRVTGTPFGSSPVALMDGVGLTETGWMRATEPDWSRVNFSEFRKRTQNEFSHQLGSLFALLGGVMVAPIFFVALLHAFKREATEHFKWALLVMWLFAFAGAVLIGIDNQGMSPNQIHILFVPLMTSFGLAFLFVCWRRLNIEGSLIRNAFVALLVIITGIPTLFGFLAGNAPIQFPPYIPAFIQIFSNWTKPDEMVVSDMPWAVAWYGDRKSVWLPARMKTFNDYYDLQTLGNPIGGMYLTPISRDLGLASLTEDDDYKEWLALLLPDKREFGTFPLQAYIGVAGNQCFYFSDRPRWSEKH